MGARSGDRKWSLETGAFEWAAPVWADGTVYATSEDGFLYALDEATGTQRWRFPIGEAKGSSPAVVGGVVYVGTSDGLYAIGGI